MPQIALNQLHHTTLVVIVAVELRGEANINIPALTSDINILKDTVRNLQVISQHLLSCCIHGEPNCKRQSVGHEFQ